MEGSNSVYTGGLDKIDIVICPVVNVEKTSNEVNGAKWEVEQEW